MQRILFGAVAFPLEAMHIKAQLDWHCRVLFGAASVTAFTICVVFCEVHLHLSTKKQLKLHKIA